MLTKRRASRAKLVQIAFRVPGVDTARMLVVGDFNDWKPTHPMKRGKDGAWRCSVQLDAGRTYEFRYLTAEGQYLNDEQADGETPNPFGGTNSVLVL